MTRIALEIVERKKLFTFCVWHIWEDPISGERQEDGTHVFKTRGWKTKLDNILKSDKSNTTQIVMEFSFPRQGGMDDEGFDWYWDTVVLHEGKLK